MGKRYIENWDDERNLDHGVIVTLKYGYSFEPNEHQGVKSFETIKEAKDAIKAKNLYRCCCDTCRKNISL